MRLRRWKPAQNATQEMEASARCGWEREASARCDSGEGDRILQMKRGMLVQDVAQEREASARCGSGEGDRILWMKRGKLAQDAAQERVTASCGQGEGS